MSEALVLHEVRWNGETDSVPGSVQQRNRTDQRCDGCGRWFSNRGISAHSENCLIREQTAYHWLEESERLVKPLCAECGGWLVYGEPIEDQPGRHENGCSYYTGPTSEE